MLRYWLNWSNAAESSSLRDAPGAGLRCGGPLPRTLKAAALAFDVAFGLPFALAHLKLAGASLAPFGCTVVSIEEARRAGGPGGAVVEVAPLGS